MDEIFKYIEETISSIQKIKDKSVSEEIKKVLEEILEKFKERRESLLKLKKRNTLDSTEDK
jgi:hypothetical protein